MSEAYHVGRLIPVRAKHTVGILLFMNILSLYHFFRSNVQHQEFRSQIWNGQVRSFSITADPKNDGLIFSWLAKMMKFYCFYWSQLFTTIYHFTVFLFSTAFCALKQIMHILFASKIKGGAVIMLNKCLDVLLLYWSLTPILIIYAIVSSLVK